MMLLDRISIFLNTEIPWWPNFGQNFDKSFKIAVFDIVCPKVAIKLPDILGLVIK